MRVRNQSQEAPPTMGDYKTLYEANVVRVSLELHKTPEEVRAMPNDDYSAVLGYMVDRDKEMVKANAQQRRSAGGGARPQTMGR